ncbi:MAG TPA: glycosyltransferase family 8 protein [Xanthomonadales bacterium]|nr:glycosyltransferase family 8 protein [Xanthomonadales bacterium]
MNPRIAILMAADERYVGPLGVTVTSIVENLRPDVALDLWILGWKLRPEIRQHVEAAWGERVRVHWAEPEPRGLAALQSAQEACADPASPASNLRLLMGSCLPETLTRVIYLDADTLVRGDLLALWEQDLEGNIVLAVQDSYIQCLPAYPPFAPDALRTHRPYFNSGVMVVDLAAWRAAHMEQRCLEAFARFPAGTRWMDQQVLNLCLADRWKAASPMWNRQFFLDLFPDWRCSPYAEADFERARHAPAVIHFCSSTKPWAPFCDHRPEDVQAYREVQQRSPLAAFLLDGNGRRSAPLAGGIRGFFAAPHRRIRDELAAAHRARHRKHALKAMLPGIAGRVLLHPWTLLSVPLSVVSARVYLWWNGFKVTAPNNRSLPNKLP